MWKLSVVVLCAFLQVNFLGSVLGNGYYGGGASGNPQQHEHQQPPQQQQQPKTADTHNPGNMWWLKNNAFQKPANHPGVERGEPQQGAPGGAEQPWNPQRQQKKAPRGQNAAGNPQAQVPTPECLLRVKSDCHRGGQVQPQDSGSQDPANYQFDPLQSYPVYTAFVIPAQQSPFPSSPQEQPSSYSPNNQQPSSYNSQNPYNSPNVGPSNQGSPSSYNQGSSYNAPAQPTNQQSPRPSAQGNPPKQSQPSNFNQISYRPPVVPYANAPAQSQNGQQPSQVQGNTNYENQPPYPGCPAAMLCVPENFCDSKGVSAGKPLPLSEAEKLFRVALMSCSSPATGEVGVCCRDPDYKDPWPMGMDTNGGGVGVQTYDNRKGKGFDDGQYRPSPHFPNHGTPNHQQQNSVPRKPVQQQQQQPQAQTQPQSSYGNYQGSESNLHAEVNSDHSVLHSTEPLFKDNDTPNFHLGQESFSNEFNIPLHSNFQETYGPTTTLEPFYNGESANEGSQGNFDALFQPDSNESVNGSGEEKVEKESDTTETLTQVDEEESVYRPNPWSYDEEFSDPKPLDAPSQFFQLPNFLPDGSQITELTTPPTITTTEEARVDQNDFGIRGGFPARKSFVEVCPNSMKCLRESYCQQPNSNEGSVADFDVRLSFRKPTKLKCKQENLPIDGVCCYLREDYMSEVTTSPFSTGVSPKPEQPANNACGVRKIKTASNPTETGFGEFPWQALIISVSKVCSGAIISERVIATAASCVHLVREEEIRARVGEWDQRTSSKRKPFQELKISTIIHHPNYSPLSMANNVALLYTQQPIVYDYHVGRVCLPQPITSFEGRQCTLTGWGSAKISPRGNINATAGGILRQADVSILPKAECVERLRKTSLGSTFKLPHPSICALPEFRQDICIGDEGSPLVCETMSTGEYKLAGFLVGTDWGVNCDQPEIPGVFSTIPPLVEWIYNFVRQDADLVIYNQQRIKNRKYY